jgi:hypothetical protein
MKVAVKMLQQFDLQNLQTAHPENDVRAGKLRHIVQQLFSAALPWHYSVWRSEICERYDTS